MIILVSGMPGSGKSTTCDLLAKRLGYERYSTGDIQRQLAKEQGLTITEWGEIEKKDPKYDLMIDKRTEEMLSTKDNFVIDTWIGAHFAKDNAVKIFLDCEEMERARRRLPQKRATEAFNNIDDIIKDMRQRVQTNQERWIAYYNYDFLDKSNYHLIIDTTRLTPVQVADRVQEFIKDFYQ